MFAYFIRTNEITNAHTYTHKKHACFAVAATTTIVVQFSLTMNDEILCCRFVSIHRWHDERKQFIFSTNIWFEKYAFYFIPQTLSLFTCVEPFNIHYTFCILLSLCDLQILERICFFAWTFMKWNISNTYIHAYNLFLIKMAVIKNKMTQNTCTPSTFTYRKIFL